MVEGGVSSKRTQASGGLLWVTVAVVAALAVLISLGTWQWQRMSWKNGLIADIRAAADQPPRAFASWWQEATARSREDVAGEEFTRVSVSGRWDATATARVYTVRDGGPGYVVFTPLQWTDASNGTPRRLLVSRGFVPQTEWSGVAPRLSQQNGEVADVSGFVRLPEADSAFTPEPDTQGRIAYGSYPFTFFPPSEMPYGGVFVEADITTLASEPTPRPRGLERLAATIPNRHFEYAMTWWGLALTLVGVYAGLLWSRRRR